MTKVGLEAIVKSTTLESNKSLVLLGKLSVESDHVTLKSPYRRSNTGSLERKSETPIVGAPSALAISPDQQTLYIGHRNSQELSSHRLNQTTGGNRSGYVVKTGIIPQFATADRWLEAETGRRRHAERLHGRR